MAPKSSEVDAYIEGMKPEAKALASEIRELIFSVAPDALEEMKWGQPCYKARQQFCYFKAAKQHITFGFNEGAGLDDPEELLEGTGKSMRHIKVDLDKKTLPKGVKTLVVQAAKG